MSSQKQIISLGLVALATLLSVVAFAGAQGAIGWSTGKYDGDASNPICTLDPEKFYLGLLGYYVQYKQEGLCVNLKEEGYYVAYDSEGSFPSSAGGAFPSDSEFKCKWNNGDENKDFCSTCDSSGKAIVSMMTFGLVAAILSLVCIYGRYQAVIKNEDAGGMKKMGALGGTVAMTVFSLISWSAWVGCNNKANDYLEDNYKVTLAGGFGMLIVVTACSGGAAAMQFLA